MTEKPKHYCLIACHVLWRELFHFSAQSKDVIHPHFLTLGLHDTPEKMRLEIQHCINNNDTGEYDAILLGYGLCGNGSLGLYVKNTPLVIMRGHDCITFLLGSKETYAEQQDDNPRAYWYSPGWIDNDKVPGMEQDERYRVEYTGKYGAEQAEVLVQLYKDSLREYTHAKYIDQGLFDRDRYEEYTRRNAEYMGLTYQRVEGSPELIKDFIEGNWDDRRFLVVKPGQKIELSIGDEIVKAE